MTGMKAVGIISYVALGILGFANGYDFFVITAAGMMMIMLGAIADIKNS